MAAAVITTLAAESATASAAPAPGSVTQVLDPAASAAPAAPVAALVPNQAPETFDVSAAALPEAVIPDASPVAARSIDADADIQNALNQAGNEFMLGVTAGSMIGGVVGLIGGCVVGAVVLLIGGCIPGLGLGAALGPIIGGVVVGVPAGIAGLIQAYNTLHAAGEISAPTPIAPAAS
ncbi:hypothetical protein ACIHDR_11305 [Nocardia sp. NPDC052278]|uniref:hypothetical protein n=1 Tax=unclassified Nocardia TaxID=2637762 RepID=UPI0036C868BF